LVVLPDVASVTEEEEDAGGPRDLARLGAELNREGDDVIGR
jgi:hypothetical protein